MLSEKLGKLMNEAIGLEIQAGLRYLWQATLWSGKDYFAMKGQLHDFYTEELEHAEQIATRLHQLGGIPDKPVISVDSTRIGGKFLERLDIALKAEDATIDLYSAIIDQAIEDRDKVTEDLFREILGDESKHQLVLSQYLKKVEE